MTQNSKRIPRIAAVAVSVCAVCLYLAFSGGGMNSRQGQTATENAAAGGNRQMIEPMGRQSAQSTPTPELQGDSYPEDLAARLGNSTDAASRQKLIDSWWERLASLPPDEAVAELRAFLDSGVNAEAGGGFVLAAGSKLEVHPSLRVAALDFLGRIDPDAAASDSERLLEISEDPDEWALALRNVSNGFPEERARPVLLEKGQELLRNRNWREQPTGGYLESFDVAVAAPDPSFVGALAEFFEPQQAIPSSSRFAAFVAIDRMTMREPEAILEELNRDGKVLAEDPSMRAGLFARADPRDEAQTAEVVAYLRRPDVSASEKSTFISNYPFFDSTTSYTLVTPPPAYSLREMRERDTAALNVLGDLSQDAGLQAHYEEINARMTEIKSLLNAPSPDNITK